MSVQRDLFSVADWQLQSGNAEVIDLRTALRVRVMAAWTQRLTGVMTAAQTATRGWPTRLLSDEEAETLADVRAQVSRLLDIEVQYLDAPSIQRRYAELMAAARDGAAQAA